MVAMRALSPSSIRPPLARYSHGFAVPADCRLVITAGQLGIGPDEMIPAGSEAQQISASQTLRRSWPKME
jgi:enamine deaminase RidA (YjgF/YER057c/UK114 family)